MTVLLCDEDRMPQLLAEVQRRHAGASCEVLAPQLLKTDAAVADAMPLMFSRQVLPKGELLLLPSVSAWARAVVEAAMQRLDETKPWRLHLVPLYGNGRAGVNRVKLIHDVVKELLQKRRRALWRTLETSEAPFQAETSLVQLVLAAPDAGVLSVSAAPEPFQARWALSPFPAGEVPVPVDKLAPSRAWTKLAEAQTRLGRVIRHGESVVDLGACPGGWTYVAVQCGARVVAVDRTELRGDLMSHPAVTFIRGDAFKFQPDEPADWMVCDVIASPERSVELLERWVRERRMRHFVVSIKFKADSDHSIVDSLATSVAPQCAEFRLLQLSANKNEACAAGTLRDG